MNSAGRTLAALGFLALAAAALAQSLRPVPPLRARVTDLTDTLRAAERDALEQRLAAFEARKGAQVAVLIVETTQPEAIEQYGIRVADAWKLGREASDDGALLLVAKNDRAIRIEVGRGLEGALTDALSNRIIDQVIVPHFRAGDFSAGIEAGVDRILSVIDGEELPPPEAGWSSREVEGIRGFLPFVLFAIPVAGGVLRRLFGRVLGPLVAGGAIFALVWLATRSLLLALAFALFTTLFAALVGTRSRTRFGRGFQRGFGGFGAGGFGGGFTGGGGSFGGGGASGRW